LSKYKTWASLNAEGKKAWGNIFPDGTIPVVSIIPKQATLQGTEKTETIFLVDCKELTSQQTEQILEKLSKNTGTQKDLILKDILKVGLPLRQRYVDSCGTSRMNLFV